MEDEDNRKELVEKNVRPRLKTRRGWNFQTREENREIEEIPKNKSKHFIKPWKNYLENIEIIETKLKGPKKENTKDAIKQAAEQAIQSLNSDYYIYTDGSTNDKQENGGAGVVIYDKNREKIEERNAAAGKMCSSYAGECVALIEAMNWIQERNKEERNKMYSIITDSMPLVNWLNKLDNKVQEGWKAEICDRLSRNKANIKVLWIPSHIDVEGNEAADNQAKEGSNKDQQLIPIERDIIVKPKIKSKKQEITHEGAKSKFGNRRKPKIEIERKWPQKVRILYSKMRTNHCTSLKVYQHKLEEEKEKNCRLCKEKVETSEHLIC